MGDEGRQEGKVVEVALGDAEEVTGADEGAEFEGRVEGGDGFAED